MPAVHCPVCVSDLAIDNFVIFPCGHGLCIDCKKRIFQGSAGQKCPNCRIHIRDQDARPVFLELVDTNIAYGLDKMDHKTSLLSVKEVDQTLRKVLQGPQPEPKTMNTLIRAIGDFNERIVPLFTKLEDQSHQIAALRDDSRRKTENLQNQLTAENKRYKDLLERRVESAAPCTAATWCGTVSLLISLYILTSLAMTGSRRN